MERGINREKKRDGIGKGDGVASQQPTSSGKPLKCKKESATVAECQNKRIVGNIKRQIDGEKAMSVSLFVSCTHLNISSVYGFVLSKYLTESKQPCYFNNRRFLPARQSRPDGFRSHPRRSRSSARPS